MTMPFSPYMLPPDVMRALQMQSPARPQDNMSTWDKMQNVVAPAPASGLLGEDDIKGARNQGLLNFGLGLLAQSGPTTQKVGFGQAIGQAGQQGMAAYQGAIDQATQRAIQKQAFDANKLKMAGMQTDMADQAKTKAARDAVFQQFPPPADDKDPHAIIAWAQHVAPALVAAGDVEGAGKVLELQKSLAGKYQFVQGGDAVYVGDPTTGQLVRGAERHMNPDELQMKKLQLDEQRARTAAMQDQANQTHLTSLSRTFQTNNHDLVKRAMPINQAILSIRNAQNDPAITKLAMGSVVQAADQNARLQLGMMQYFSSLDPSIAGKWSALKSRLLEGKLPLYQSGQVLRHLQSLLVQTQGEWNRRRAGEVKRHPALNDYIPQGDEIFNLDDSQAPAGQYDPDSLRGQFGSLSQ